MKVTVIENKKLKNFLKLKKLENISIETKSYIFGNIYTFTLELEDNISKESITLATQVFKASKNKVMSYYEDVFIENCKDILGEINKYYEN